MDTVPAFTPSKRPNPMNRNDMATAIMQLQQTVDFKKLENVEYQLSGRHDPCIVHRARIVIDSMIAITLCDMLMMRYGELYFNGGFKE